MKTIGLLVVQVKDLQLCRIGFGRGLHIHITHALHVLHFRPDLLIHHTVVHSGLPHHSHSPQWLEAEQALWCTADGRLSFIYDSSFSVWTEHIWVFSPSWMWDRFLNVGILFKMDHVEVYTCIFIFSKFTKTLSCMYVYSICVFSSYSLNIYLYFLAGCLLSWQVQPLNFFHFNFNITMVYELERKSTFDLYIVHFLLLIFIRYQHKL